MEPGYNLCVENSLEVWFENQKLKHFASSAATMTTAGLKVSTSTKWQLTWIGSCTQAYKTFPFPHTKGRWILKLAVTNSYETVNSERYLSRCWDSLFENPRLRRSLRDREKTNKTIRSCDTSQMILKPRSNDRNLPIRHIATLLGATCCVRLSTMLRCAGCCWLKFENGQIWANHTQHVATHCDRVAKRTQHFAPSNVVICCIGMKRSFGRALTDWIKRPF